MKRLPLCLFVFALAACAKQSKSPSKITQPDVAMSPAEAPGLWLDSSRAKAFEQTGHVSEDDCTASSDQREEAVKVFEFAKNNSILSGNELYYSYEKGVLIPQRPELMSTSDHAYTYSLRRKGKRVRVHFASKDLKTGAVTEADQPLTRISDSTAHDFLAQEDACAARPVAKGRLTQLGLGSGDATVGTSSAQRIPLGRGSADPIRCDTSADAVTIAAGTKLVITLPASDPLDGKEQLLQPGDKRLQMDLGAEKFTADCTLKAKRTGGVLEASLSCTNGISAEVACPRQAVTVRD